MVVFLSYVTQIKREDVLGWSLMNPLISILLLSKVLQFEWQAIIWQFLNLLPTKFFISIDVFACFTPCSYVSIKYQINQVATILLDV